MFTSTHRFAVLTAAAAVAAAVALSACSSSTDKPKDTMLLRAVAVSRPVVSQADLDATAQSSAAFGLDILHQLAAPQTGTAGAGGGKNLMVSPASLTSVLGMLLPGAKGATATEMQRALHTALPGDRYAAAVGALNMTSAQRAAGDQADLQQFDALWAQKGWGIRPDYLNTLSAAFDTGVHEVDFAKNADRARQDIDSAVEQQTKGLIKELFPPGSIDASTRLALTDALYFKAKWATPFQPEATAQLPFSTLSGPQRVVATMARTDSLGYAQGAGWQYAELPYAGGHLAMDIVLPQAGTFTQFRDHLDAASLAAMSSAAQPTRVDLHLPKFAFDSGSELTKQLQTLGMTSLFDPGTADVSGIPAQAGEPLYVGIVVEKTHVAVAEDGTTAAAAAGAAVRASSAVLSPDAPAAMHVDRPFLFLIRDTASGQVLFLGQVVDPQS
jgi:serpin B